MLETRVYKVDCSWWKFGHLRLKLDSWIHSTNLFTLTWNLIIWQEILLSFLETSHFLGAFTYLMNVAILGLKSVDFAKALVKNAIWSPKTSTVFLVTSIDQVGLKLISIQTCHPEMDNTMAITCDTLGLKRYKKMHKLASLLGLSAKTNCRFYLKPGLHREAQCASMLTNNPLRAVDKSKKSR